jgi:hypothetical protein
MDGIGHCEKTRTLRLVQSEEYIKPKKDQLFCYTRMFLQNVDSITHRFQIVLDTKESDSYEIPRWLKMFLLTRKLGEVLIM